MVITKSNDAVSFIEIFGPSGQQVRHDDDTNTDNIETDMKEQHQLQIPTSNSNPRTIALLDVYVVTIDNPKECSTFIKHLSSTLPLSSSLSHLKRVHSITGTSTLSSIRRCSDTRTSSGNMFRQDHNEENDSTANLNDNKQFVESNPDVRNKRSSDNVMTTTSNMNDVPLQKSTPNISHKRPKKMQTATQKQLKVLIGTKEDIEQRFGPFLLLQQQQQQTSSSPETTDTTDHLQILSSNATVEDSKNLKLLSNEKLPYYDFCSTVLYPLQYPNDVYATLEIIKVPKYPPRSEDQWRIYNNTIWSTSYLPNQMLDNIIIRKEKELQLTTQELDCMMVGMNAAIQDATNFQSNYIESTASNAVVIIGGVVIVCPKTNQIITTAYSEYITTINRNSGTKNNPLCTSYIYAIRGISRIERKNNNIKSKIQESVSLKHYSDVIKNNNVHKENRHHACDYNIEEEQSQQEQEQYLCTGYDVYATIEPTIYEAMALLHSRIRRLVFGCSISDVIHKINSANNSSSGTKMNTIRTDSGIVETNVHALPSTNHHYRAFMCAPDSDLWAKCCTSSVL